MAQMEASRLEETFSFTFRVGPAPEEEILAALAQGMRSEVAFRVQLYRESSGFWSIFGDRLVEEYETLHLAYFDPFTRSYIIAVRGDFTGSPHSYEDPEEFLAAFLSLRSTRLALPGGREGYRLRGRSIIEPVRVAPPLGLMGIFSPSERYTTPWVSAEL